MLSFRIDPVLVSIGPLAIRGTRWPILRFCFGLVAMFVFGHKNAAAHPKRLCDFSPGRQRNVLGGRWGSSFLSAHLYAHDPSKRSR